MMTIKDYYTHSKKLKVNILLKDNNEKLLNFRLGKETEKLSSDCTKSKQAYVACTLKCKYQQHVIFIICASLYLSYL